MESHGESLKIHVSPDLKAILDEFVTFDLTLRGEIEVKVYRISDRTTSDQETMSYLHS